MSYSYMDERYWREQAKLDAINNESEQRKAKAILEIQFTKFTSLGKKIVLLWAENLDDADIRVAMLELREKV